STDLTCKRASLQLFFGFRHVVVAEDIRKSLALPHLVLDMLAPFKRINGLRKGRSKQRFDWLAGRHLSNRWCRGAGFSFGWLFSNGSLLCGVGVKQTYCEQCDKGCKPSKVFNRAM